MTQIRKLLENVETLEMMNQIRKFPSDANVFVSITGLALCRLKTDVSTIDFISHAPLHELELSVFRIKRDLSAVHWLLDSKIAVGHDISIESSDSMPFDSLETAPQSGELPLKHILNLPYLHGKPLKRVTPPMKPISLSLKNFSFYTETLDESLRLEETIDDVVQHGKPPNAPIGKILGGKMNCAAGKKTILTINGSSKSESDLPEQTDYVHVILFTNDCIIKEVCRERLEKEKDTDFRYYYHLVKDSDNPGRKFKVPKDKKTAEVAACVPAVEDPPISPIP